MNVLYFRAIGGHSQEILLLILCCKTMYSYRNDSQSTSTTIGNANELNSIVRNSLIPRGKNLKRWNTSSLLHNSEPDGGRMWHWEKLHAISRNQGSRHTRILGNAFKIRICWRKFDVRSRERPCNFTRHSHMQSYSATHNLQLALRKRYV